MGVYIKGVKMPIGNNELRLIIHSNGQVIISHQTYYEEAEAVPVPPHGDLIDRDALTFKKKTVLTGIGSTSFATESILISDIKNAPTIIPADKEDE